MEKRYGDVELGSVVEDFTVHNGEELLQVKEPYPYVIEGHTVLFSYMTDPRNTKRTVTLARFRDGNTIYYAWSINRSPAGSTDYKDVFSKKTGRGIAFRRLGFARSRRVIQLKDGARPLESVLFDIISGPNDLDSSEERRKIILKHWAEGLRTTKRNLTIGGVLVAPKVLSVIAQRYLAYMQLENAIESTIADLRAQILSLDLEQKSSIRWNERDYAKFFEEDAAEVSDSEVEAARENWFDTLIDGEEDKFDEV